MILIYDGECDFCRNCVKWIQSRTQLEAIPYQSADLTPFLLSEAEAVSSVHLVTRTRTLTGADAVAHLLKLTHLKFLGIIVNSLGPLSRLAYRWIAHHRDSFLVNILNRIVVRTIGREN